MPNPSLKLADSKWGRYVKTYFSSLGGKRIGFYGNFGHGDQGDDASFYVANQLFQGSLVPVSKRAHAFHPSSYRAFLIGGGGILRWEAPYIPRRLLRKKKWPFPVMTLAIGVNCDYGCEYSKESLEQIRSLFEMCDAITVRDLETQRFAAQLGFKDTHLLPDLEILLEAEPVKEPCSLQRPTVGFVLSPHSEFSQNTNQKIVEEFAKLANILIDQGKDILILPFDHKEADTTREKQIIEALIQQIRLKDHVQVLPYDLSPAQLLYAINTYCESMVVMRLHSAIYALNAGVPFICLGFNLMHRAFLELIERSTWEVPMDQGWDATMLMGHYEQLQVDIEFSRKYLTDQKQRLKTQIIDQLQVISQPIR